MPEPQTVPTDRNNFEGKVALITGGAMGFGAAFGEALAERGAVVGLADINAERVTGTAERLVAKGYKAVPIRCDVRDEAEVERVVTELGDQNSGIDILVNNAGLHLTKYNLPFTQLARNDIRDLFDVNVIGVINCSISCLEQMKRRGGGSIVNLSSNAAYNSVSPYGISKLAVRGLTVAMAIEFAPANIRVNAIAPGLMATQSAVSDLDPGLMDDIVNRRQLIKRMGSVADIVSTLLFLCAPDGGSFMTGETIRVAGGWPLQM